jgi:hypothetical protein
MYAHASSLLYTPAPDRARKEGLCLYRRSLSRGRRARFWSRLTRRSRPLLELKSIEENCTVRARSTATRCTVPIVQIRGSGGRARDFDQDFSPLQAHTQERWLRIVLARKQGKDLPPVSLARVGDVFFVLDGHHRISVARVLGQTDIEATVVVWHVDGPLPWHASQQETKTGRLSLGIKVLRQKVLSVWVTLHTRPWGHVPG